MNLLALFAPLQNFVTSVAAGVDSILQNPVVDHLLNWAGDYFLGHAFWTKTSDGDKTKREVNPAWLRREAPKHWAGTHLDETLFRLIMYATNQNGGVRTALLDNWGPPNPPLPLMDDPRHDLGQIGPHQWDDFRLTLIDELFTGPDNAKILLTGPEFTEKLTELAAFVTELSEIDAALRLRELIHLNYCKPREGDYKIVQVERFLGRRFKNLKDFLDWIKRPDGFLQLARSAAQSIDAQATRVAPSIRSAAYGVFRTGPAVQRPLNALAISLNNQANRIRPTGWIRFFIGN